MQLNKFCELTLEEKENHIKLLLLIDREDYYKPPALTEITHQIGNADLVFLIKLALDLSVFDDLCKDDSLQSYWDNIWQKCSDENNLVPLPTIHTFDLLKGIYLYWSYLKIQQNSNGALSLLKKSAELKCLVAIQALADVYFKNLKLQLDKADINQLLTVALLAQSHQTPGYKLSAKIYSKLYLIIKQRQGEMMAMPYQKLADDALLKAESVKEISQPFMHNANQFSELKDLQLLLQPQRTIPEEITSTQSSCVLFS